MTEIAGLGDALTQNDFWWVHVIGQPQAIEDYAVHKRNRSLDVGHSTDQKLRVGESNIVVPRPEHHDRSRHGDHQRAATP